MFKKMILGILVSFLLSGVSAYSQSKTASHKKAGKTNSSRHKPGKRYANMETSYRKKSGNEVAVESIEKTKAKNFNRGIIAVGDKTEPVQNANSIVFEPDSQPNWAYLHNKSKSQKRRATSSRKKENKPNANMKVVKPAKPKSITEDNAEVVLNKRPKK